MFEIFCIGMGLGFSLIAAIGAQNVFVITQGVRQEHVFAVCLICSLSDAVLLFLGVTSFQTIRESMRWLEDILRYGGGLFLVWYGARSLYSALRSSGTLFLLEKEKSQPLGRTVLMCMALTWLNPHVYLDTVVMMGMLSTGFPGQEFLFAAGAATASCCFFFGLGYGARFLRPYVMRPKVWRICEGVIGVFMWGIALKLLWPDSMK